MTEDVPSILNLPDQDFARLIEEGREPRGHPSKVRDAFNQRDHGFYGGLRTALRHIDNRLQWQSENDAKYQAMRAAALQTGPWRDFANRTLSAFWWAVVWSEVNRTNSATVQDLWRTSPLVRDGRLHTKYYSKGLPFSPPAWTTFVPPDLQPLELPAFDELLRDGGAPPSQSLVQALAEHGGGFQPTAHEEPSGSLTRPFGRFGNN